MPEAIGVHTIGFSRLPFLLLLISSWSTVWYVYPFLKRTNERTKGKETARPLSASYYASHTNSVNGSCTRVCVNKNKDTMVQGPLSLHGGRGPLSHSFGCVSYRERRVRRRRRHFFFLEGFYSFVVCFHGHRFLNSSRALLLVYSIPRRRLCVCVCAHIPPTDDSSQHIALYLYRRHRRLHHQQLPSAFLFFLFQFQIRKYIKNYIEKEKRFIFLFFFVVFFR
jgi:hypothetical protein